MIRSMFFNDFKRLHANVMNCVFHYISIFGIFLTMISTLGGDMVTGAEIALGQAVVKSVVDAVSKLTELSRFATTIFQKRAAKKALADLVTELLKISPDLKAAERKVVIAKALGIFNADLQLVEEMIAKHKASAAKPAAKKAAAKPAAKKAAAKPAAKKAAAKPAAKKAAAKPAAKKVAAKRATKKA